MLRIAAVSLCLFLAAGCEPAGPVATTAPAPVEAPRTAEAPAPTTRPAGGAVMARVNGEPIALSALYDLLLRGPGLQYARELIRHEVVFQAGRDKGLSVTEADVDAERERFMETIAPQLDPEMREQVLKQVMARKQVSPEQWRLMLEARAILRKLAVEGLEIPDDAVRDEFHRQHGRKVVVRHIQSDTLDAAQKVLDLAQKDEADFAALAQEHSTHASASSGGELPPFGPNSDRVPPAFREAALALEEAGDVSNPVRVGESFHVIELVRTIEPADVTFEDVRAQMRAVVRERMLAARQQTILRELMDETDVEYVNPILKHQHEAAETGRQMQP
ncbi:MAG: peptidylprolyl isomerase [Phycisphaerae bacterium]|nr:peptidylprolyl isomerase [Phycisphaerae bacterium]